MNAPGIRLAWDNVPRSACMLGLAGIAPQALAVIAALSPTWRFTALSAGFFYAALILSFVGGVWWGVAFTQSKAPQWIYPAAVAPSLIALGTGVPWMIGAHWPWPSLAVLGTALLASPIMDIKLRSLGFISDAALSLRIVLSVGLGIMTLLLASL
jgi:hypothetical protein